MKFRLIEEKTITVNDRDFNELKYYLNSKNINYKEVDDYRNRYYSNEQDPNESVKDKINWFSKAINEDPNKLQAFESKYKTSFNTLYKLCYNNNLSLKTAKNLLNIDKLNNESDSDITFKIKTIAFLSNESLKNKWVNESDKEAVQHFENLKNNILDLPSEQIQQELDWLEKRHNDEKDRIEQSNQPIERQELEKEYDLYKSGNKEIKNNKNTTYFNIRKDVGDKNAAGEKYQQVLKQRERSKLNKKDAREKATTDVKTRERLAKETEGERGKSILSKVLNKGREKKTLNRQDVYDYVKQLMDTDSPGKAGDAIAKMIDDGKFDNELDDVLNARYSSPIGNKTSDKLNDAIVKTINASLHKIANPDENK